MMETIIIAAKAKFGEVEEIAQHKNGGYILMIRRSDPVKESFPYMTIRAGIQEGKVDFHWGYYDLTEDQARKDFQTR